MNSYRQPDGGPSSRQALAMLQPSRSSFASYTPPIYTVRPNNKVGFQNQGRNSFGRQTTAYGAGAGAGRMNEARWSFSAPYCPLGSFQQQQQKPSAFASFNGYGGTAARKSSSIGAVQRRGGGSAYTNLRPPAYITPPALASYSSVAPRASATGQPTNQQPQQFQNANSNSRTDAYSNSNASKPVQLNPTMAGTVTAASDQQLPPEGENVKYVQLNWEDILGGKDGLNALRVTMAPPTKDNPNRQLSIGFGSGTDGQTADGSVPLKVIKFEPLQSYPGQVASSSSAAPASGAASTSNSPGPSPRSLLANMTVTAAPARAANSNYAQPQPSQPRVQMQQQMQTGQGQEQSQSPLYMNYINANAAAGGAPMIDPNDPQMQQLMQGINVKQFADGQPMISLPPGFKLANPGQMNMASNGNGNGSANASGQFQAQKQCSCPACQYR